MTASRDFADFLHEHLAPLGALRLRRMFGKTGVFCEGVMFAVVADNTLYLRVDDKNRTAFGEAAPALTYEKHGRTIALAYRQAPDRLFDNPEDLTSWCRSALAAAHRVAQTRAKPAAKRK